MIPTLLATPAESSIDWLTLGERYGALLIVAWLVWFIFTKGLPQMLARQAAEMTAMRLEAANAADRHDTETQVMRTEHNQFVSEQRTAFLEALALQRADFKAELEKRHEFEKEISAGLKELLMRG